MAEEKMNTGMEKVFFNYILENPKEIAKVESYYFRNEDIQFIYTVIRDEYMLGKSKDIPVPNQILAMVKLNDTDNKISPNIVKLLLKKDEGEQYEDEWLQRRFRAWKISNQARNKASQTIDRLRSIEELNYDNVVNVVTQIKQLYNDISLMDMDEEDLGDDFDDPEAHKQTHDNSNISTGWATLDTLLSGGWNHASLNVIMGETNIGKCTHKNTQIQIRNNVN